MCGTKIDKIVTIEAINEHKAIEPAAQCSIQRRCKTVRLVIVSVNKYCPVRIERAPSNCTCKLQLAIVSKTSPNTTLLHHQTTAGIVPAKRSHPPCPAFTRFCYISFCGSFTFTFALHSRIKPLRVHHVCCCCCLCVCADRMLLLPCVYRQPPVQSSSRATSTPRNELRENN